VTASIEIINIETFEDSKQVKTIENFFENVAVQGFLYKK
jgi:hypothetical protein